MKYALLIDSGGVVGGSGEAMCNVGRKGRLPNDTFNLPSFHRREDRRFPTSSFTTLSISRSPGRESSGMLDVFNHSSRISLLPLQFDASR